MDRLILGIDAGGTQTRAWLAVVRDDSFQIVGEGNAGPGNPLVSTFNQATGQLSSAVQEAFDDAGIRCRKVERVCLAVAGAGSETMNSQLNQWCTDAEICEEVVVTSDADALFAAGKKQSGSVCLIAGTGSIAFGRTDAGIEVRAGGWGHLIGDEGSGYWIAMQGLNKVVQAADQRSDKTLLTDQFLNTLNANNVPELVKKAHDNLLTKADRARWARIVFEAAEQHDQAAVEIVKRAGVHLADLVESVYRRIETAEPLSLVCSGGVLLNQPSLVEKIANLLRTRGIHIDEFQFVQQPAAGALNIAFQSLQES